MTIWLLHQKVYILISLKNGLAVFRDKLKWNLLMLIRICT